MDTEELDKTMKQTQRLKVLFVEDSEVVRASTIEILEQFFDDITIAVDGDDGYDKFISNKDRKFDLIISDIAMPKLNGLDMSQKIREVEPFIPILLLTAFSETNYLLRGIELNIDGYLNKPLDVDKFIFYLKRILHNIDRQSSQNHESKILLNTVSKNVIMSRTNLKGVITYVSDAFCEISGYTRDELIGQPQSMVRHPDMPSETFMYMWSVIPNEQTWEGEVKNLKKMVDIIGYMRLLHLIMTMREIILDILLLEEILLLKKRSRY